MKKVTILPAMLTLGNAALGFTAVATVVDAAYSFSSNAPLYHEKLKIAIFCIFGAMVCDALDGAVARMVRGATEFGGYLDSLADIVSFGIAPALIVKAIIKLDFQLFQGINWDPWSKITWLVTGMFCLGAILRLARFNAENAPDAESHQYFEGLPTPPAAGLLISLALLYIIDSSMKNVMFWTMIIAGPFLGVMMVSRVRYIHLINKVLLGEHTFQYIALFAAIIVAVSALGVYEYALAAGFLAYALWGPAVTIFRKPKSFDESSRLGKPSVMSRN
jgi:CDP-diacylglycerol--serine O-phosphatidyltransferase